ncbi:MAG: TonB-dependent siderophore receptor [Sphingobium sp.]|uniref:TonB-dependent siderophore receptor n=1 Tax=Sphingobium sp. TaxID=1912891 RepID=UPI0029A6B6CB|nr:TonB-dependent siderophore receptor [Sphingobium sp.]MDX3911704.1 TonB-dependent siderophore receptor [Sphingobium sp.]
MLTTTALAAGVVIMPVVVHAQSAQSYDVPAGPLAVALNRFAEASDIKLFYYAALTNGLSSPRLKGSFGPAEALSHLLAGSGLTFRQTGPDAFTLERAPTSADSAIQLGPVRVEGAGEAGGSAALVSLTRDRSATEGTGSYTMNRPTSSATRLDLTLRETPQSVTIITRDRMDDFGLKNIDDVMRQTPGITVAAYDSDRTMYYSRGFSINNFLYDGLVSNHRNIGYAAGNTTSDMAIYDRIEVLKGVSGLTTGVGSLGGSINLIRKRPTTEFQGIVELSAGSWDNYRGQIDVGGPLTADGTIRVRGVAAYQDTNSFMDRYSRQTLVFYGIGEIDLSPDTMLTVGADFQDSRPEGSTWSGTYPLFNAAGGLNSVPRSYSNAARWSHWDQSTRTIFGRVEHDFGNGWTGKLQLERKVNMYDAPLGTIQGSYPYSDGSAAIYSAFYGGKTRSNSLDLQAKGPLHILGGEHDLVVGLYASRSRWRGNGDWSTPADYDGTVADFYNWDGNIAKPTFGPWDQVIDDITKQFGGYMTARIGLFEGFKLIAGGRLITYDFDGRGATIKVKNRLTPYLAATYELTRNLSVYASYADVFMPQDPWVVDRNNRILDPNNGKNYEVGLKASFLDNRLNASAAYFQVHESNRQGYDDIYNASPTNPAVDWAYIPIKAKTKGFEVEVSGEVRPGWQLQAGYTHKVTRDSTGAEVSTFEPRDQFTFYTSYKPQAIEGLSVGGGLRFQGKNWQDVYNSPLGEYHRFSQSNFVLVDLMTSYNVNRNISVFANLNNLFDKTYLTNVGFYQSGAFGTPRSFLVTAKYKY